MAAPDEESAADPQHASTGKDATPDASVSARLLGLVPGVYRVRHGCDVSEGSLLESNDTASLEPGDYVAVLELENTDSRVRAYIAEPPGWFSVASDCGTRRWAEPVPVGLYAAVRGLDVTQGPELESRDVSAFEEGETFQVKELLLIEKRLRGRIGQGWVSLVNTENGGRWAVHVATEEAEVLQALSEGQLLKESSVPYSAIRRLLERRHKELQAAHRSATEAWRQPLSLFSEGSASRARAAGVPDWAVAAVEGGCALVLKASELIDLADTYGAQINAAERGDKGLHRAALLSQLQRLSSLASALSSALPLLKAARAAFDRPDDAPREPPLVPPIAVPEDGSSREPAREVILEKKPVLFEAASEGLGKVKSATLNLVDAAAGTLDLLRSSLSDGGSFGKQQAPA